LIGKTAPVGVESMTSYASLCRVYRGCQRTPGGGEEKLTAGKLDLAVADFGD